LTDTEIKVGQTSAYSGPAWAYGTLSKIEVAYARMINERGACDDHTVDAIPVSDHIARSLVTGECLCDLSRNPISGRMCCDVDPDKISAV
jgi:hypothetical protein